MMGRSLFALVLVPVLSLCALAQSSSRIATARTKNEAFHGLRLVVVPDVLYAHVANLPKGQGLLVKQVTPESPAAQAGLKIHDIVLTIGGKDIKDGDHFATLIRKHKPTKAERKVPVVLLRGGKEVTLEVGLTVLHQMVETDPGTNSRGYAKTGKPPTVSCKATALGGERLQVTFEYYPVGNGKLKRNTFSGSLDEIEAKVQDLPMPVQDLARVALKRLRAQKDK
jgi:membrane-associated protease RseP (regulator of RpoE activity)